MTRFRHIQLWQRIRESRSLAGIREVIAQLAIAFVHLEGWPIDLDDLVTVHVFDLWRFPTHIDLSFLKADTTVSAMS
jgi:hypothetical protein